jgi:hypothetical protein
MGPGRGGREGVSKPRVEGRGGSATERSPNHVVAIRSMLVTNRNHVEGRGGAEEGSAARVGGLAAIAR